MSKLFLKVTIDIFWDLLINMYGNFSCLLVLKYEKSSCSPCECYRRSSQPMLQLVIICNEGLKKFKDNKLIYQRSFGFIQVYS